MLQMKLIMMVLLSDPAPSDWLGQCGQSKKKKNHLKLSTVSVELRHCASRPSHIDQLGGILDAMVTTQL
jgi:hypothetical protein